MDKALETAVKKIKQNLQGMQIHCTDEKAINYGWQLTCTKDGQTARLNVYCGKKGISLVVQGKESPLKALLGAISAVPAESKGDVYKPGVSGANTAPFTSSHTMLHPAGIDTWMGCDESGKGDVFGPLVGAACLIRADEEETLRRIGVCDSKLLTDKEIVRISQEILRRIGDRAVVTTLLPVVYNARYAIYKERKQNLNHLLGDLHSQNIRSLLSKYKCPCIIVDKFGKDEYVLRGLKEEAKTRQIIQVAKGERDVAVAAASILARQAFVEAMHTLSDTYGIHFPKGAYLGISDTIRRFRCKHGDKALHYVGKLNFKNFDFLRT